MDERRIISDLGDLYEAASKLPEYGTYHVPELDLDVTEHPQVLSPRLSFSGIWTAQNWDLEPGMSTLDMGTGTGILGVAAAVRAGASRVVSADISPFALECATRTAAMNGVSDRMKVVESNLYDALGESGKYDRVIFNPPFWDKVPDPNDKLTWASCDPGRKILRKFLDLTPDFLAHHDSRVLIVFSTQDNFAAVEEMIRSAKGLTVKGEVREVIEHPRVLFSLGKDE